MPNKTGYKKTTNPQEYTPTVFELKWGEPAYEIAERENVATTTIHMRVHNYGTPFQRKAKPSEWESKYGKTKVEICKELYLHPNSLILRERTHGNVYCEDKLKSVGTYRNTKIPMFSHTKHWTELPHFKGDRFWLMPEHPDYKEQREISRRWDCQKHISLAKAKS
jgi:hypothetical protein